MIRKLKIENYAIIDNLEIDFTAGLNTITGETGAGKSILLGALELLAGGKAEAAAFADNEKNCVIEAVFTISTKDSFYADNDIHAVDGEVVVRRTISPSGRSRAFVNDEPVSLTLLRELSQRLVDIHSQHQTLLLSKADYQTQIVDSISGYSIENYEVLYRNLRQRQKELKILIDSAENNRRRAEFLEYQIEQIEQAGVNPDEIAEMEQRQKILSNATDIVYSLGYATGAMQHDDMGVVITLKNALNSVLKIRDSLPQAEEFAERLNSLYLESKDLASEMENQVENIEVNPAELQQIDEHLDTVYTLLHKHSVETPEELLELCDSMQSELDEIVDVDSQVEKLQAKIQTMVAELKAEADKVGEARRKVAPKIEKEIIETLRELGIKDARFTLMITTTDDFTATGTDKISMLFSANAGKNPQPIESVASGGEMSRVMLSIKGLISQTSELSTIIFDEIDTGVSGVVAHKMGEIIVRMSRSMQVLNITHLPQVASKGESHYLVYKDAQGTHIRRLTHEQRIDHIATMLSGSEVTESARKQAIELIKN